MTSFAWVIDQTSCIRCHACTTACTSENEVPLGVNRTWVKYVETGTFPQTRRQIAVLRCNHCALARPGPGPGGLRRPEWLLHPLRPVAAAYRVADDAPAGLE